MSTRYNIDDGLSSITVIRVDEHEESIPPALSTSSGCDSRGPSDLNATPLPPTFSTHPSAYMASTSLQDNKPETRMTFPSPTAIKLPASFFPQPSNVIMTNTDDGTIADQSDDKNVVKVRDDLLLFPRLRRGRANPFSSILKSGPSRIPNDDRVTL